jgi:hypothetical protein
MALIDGMLQERTGSTDYWRYWNACRMIGMAAAQGENAGELALRCHNQGVARSSPLPPHRADVVFQSNCAGPVPPTMKVQRKS